MKEIHPKILRTDTGPKRIAKPEAMTPPAAATNATVPGAAVPAKSQAKRATFRRRVLLVALGLSVFCYFGQQRRPIGPSAGALGVRTIVPAVAAEKPARLMIGTYNIHMGKGTDGRTDLSRIAGVIGGLDFIGLNEVLGPGLSLSLSEQKDQAAALAEELKMTPLYTPTEERWWHAKFGNGFLTKLDVRSWQVVPLERRYGKSYRNFVHIRAKAANGTPLNIVVTHIDRSDDRERHAQLNTVGEYFKSLEKPAIWLGDLNTDANEPVMVRLLEGSDITDAVGKAMGFSAPRHIDWILTRGLEVKNAGLSPVGPSDHAHIWAELEVPAQPKGVARRSWDMQLDLALAMPLEGKVLEQPEQTVIQRMPAVELAEVVAEAGLNVVREFPTPAPAKWSVVHAIDNMKGFHVPWRINDSLGRMLGSRLSSGLSSADRAPSTELLNLVNDTKRWGRFEAPPMTQQERVRWNRAAGGIVINR
jgi:endonuclease/exonuclease/phosphatase family metal-dependent hydrolase